MTGGCGQNLSGMVKERPGWRQTHSDLRRHSSEGSPAWMQVVERRLPAAGRRRSTTARLSSPNALHPCRRACAGMTKELDPGFHQDDRVNPGFPLSLAGGAA